MKKLKIITLSLLTASLLSFNNIEKKYIVIDAGHGGADLGANRDGISEKDITLKIATAIKDFNDSEYEVILTRNSDEYIELEHRASKINDISPEIAISLHLNSSAKPESDIRGQEIYIQDNEASKKIAEKISRKFNSCPIKEENLHILRNTKSPTVVVELGYINNQKDREYLSSEAGQIETAKKFIEIIKEK